MPSRNVTIKDVAREAGVSFKTVSNVINGNDDQMRAETKNRVEKAIAKLGYHVNRSARALKTGKTGIIGLGMSDFDQPFEGHLTNAITKAAHNRGYTVIVSLYGKDASSRAAFSASSRRISADGWALLYEEPIDSSSSLFQQEYPIVLISDYSSQNMFDIVTMPNADAARYATTWLFEHGASTVGFIGAPPELFTKYFKDNTARETAALTAVEGNAALRLQGFIQATHAHGNNVDWNSIAPCDRMTGLSGANATFGLIQRGLLPDAFLCVNDAVAMGVISALNRSGIAVPNDIQVCGFDNIPDGALSSPPLTTIDPNIDQYAQLAVDALIARINGHNLPPSVFTSGFRLLERQSTLHQ